MTETKATALSEAEQDRLVAVFEERRAGTRTDDNGILDAVEAIVTAYVTAAEDRMREAVAKWSGCWCGEQQYPDHDPRVRDCPQHGSDDCRHMAEGIVADIRAALATEPTT